MTKFKRLLVLSIAGVLGLGLAACGETPSPSVEPTPQPTESAKPSTPTPSTPEESTPAVELYAPDALVMVEDTFKTLTTFTDSRQLDTQTVYFVGDEAVYFPLTWELKNVSKDGFISLGEVANNKLPLNVKYGPENDEVVTFTLKCTVTNPNNPEDTASFEYEYSIPKFEYSTYADFKAAAADKDPNAIFNMVGTVTSVYKNGVYFVDDDGQGYFAYLPADLASSSDADLNLAQYPIGTRILVSGKATNNYSVPQFAKDSTIKILEAAGTDYEIPYKNATSAFEAAASVQDASLFDYLNTPVVLENVKMGSINTTDHYYYFTVGEGTARYYLRPSDSYNNFDLTNGSPLNVNNIVADWNEGYTATIKGIAMSYNGNFYVTPVEMDAVEITGTEVTDAQKVDFALSAADEKYSALYKSDEITLDATDANGISYTYEVVSGTGIVYDATTGKLTLTQSTTELVNILRVTATLNGVTESREITITLQPSGADIITIEEALELGASKAHNTYTEEKYYVTGVITEVYNDQYGNMYITDGTNTITVYGTYSADGSQRYDAMTVKPVAGDTVTVYGVVGQYNGTAQLKNAWITDHKVAGYDTLTIEAALELGASKAHNTYTEEKYYVTGVITEVYNTQYGNMYITDGTNTITVYGTYSADGSQRYDAMTVKPVAGDTVTVYGVVGQYNGTAQLKNAWITDHEPAGSTDPDEPGTNPDEPSTTITTIEAALAASEGAVQFTGVTVTEIYEAWSSFNNMSFYVSDGTNKILVFRTSNQVGLGDVVNVTGTITLHNSKPQIAQGATVTVTTAHECSTYTDATCAEPAKCEVCGEANGVALGHTEANAEGKCDRCGVDLALTTTTVSQTMADLISANGWTSSTTKQQFNLDEVVSVKINGGSNTGKAYNDNHIRIYATDTPAGTITISVAEGYQLVSVKISAETGTYAFLCVDGTTTDICNVSTTVTGSSVVLKSVKNGSDGKQIRVTGIEVVYAPVAE